MVPEYLIFRQENYALHPLRRVLQDTAHFLTLNWYCSALVILLFSLMSGDLLIRLMSASSHMCSKETVTHSSQFAVSSAAGDRHLHKTDLHIVSKCELVLPKESRLDSGTEESAPQNASEEKVRKDR